MSSSSSSSSGLPKNPEWFGIPSNSGETHVEFYVFDAVTFSNNVVLFGKTKHGQSMCIRIEDTWDQWYFISNHSISTKEDEPPVLNDTTFSPEKKSQFEMEVKQFLFTLGSKIDGKIKDFQIVKYLYPSMFHATVKPVIHSESEKKFSNKQVVECYETVKATISNPQAYSWRKDLYIQEGGKYKNLVACRVFIEKFNMFSYHNRTQFHQFLKDFRLFKQLKKHPSAASASTTTTTTPDTSSSTENGLQFRPLSKSQNVSLFEQIKTHKEKGMMFDILPASDCLLNQFRLEKQVKGFCKISIPYTLLNCVPLKSKRLSSCKYECSISYEQFQPFQFIPSTDVPFPLKAFSLQTNCQFEVEQSVDQWGLCYFPFLSFRFFEHAFQEVSPHIPTPPSPPVVSVVSPLARLVSQLLQDPHAYFWTWNTQEESRKAILQKFEHYAKQEPLIKRWLEERRICVFDSQKDMFESFYTLFSAEDPDLLLTFQKGDSHELARLVFAMQKSKVHPNSCVFNRWKDRYYDPSRSNAEQPHFYEFRTDGPQSLYTEWTQHHLTRGRLMMDLFDKQDSFLSPEDLAPLKHKLTLAELGKIHSIRIFEDVYREIPSELFLHCFHHHFEFFAQEVFVNSLIEQEILSRAFKHSNCFWLHFSLAGSTGVLLAESFLSNRSFLNEQFLSFCFHKEGYLLPTAEEVFDSVQHWERASSLWETALGIQFKQGGKSLDSQTGLRSQSYLEMLDVKSSYPSQVIEFGLCFTKFPQFAEAANPLNKIQEKEDLALVLDREIAKKVTESLVYKKMSSEMRKDIVSSSSSGDSLSEEQTHLMKSWGPLPRALYSLVHRRSVLQAKLKDPSLSLESRKMFESLRQSFKLIVNTVCGCFWQPSFRFYNPIFGRLVPLLGRQTLRLLYQRVESKTDKIPIFGVTDSLLFDTKKTDIKEVSAFTTDILQEVPEEDVSQPHKLGINTLYPFIQVELNHIFRANLTLSKSAYVGIVATDPKGKVLQWVHKSLTSDASSTCLFAQRVASYLAHELVLQAPDLVQRIHQCLLDAGVQMVHLSETNHWDAFVCHHQLSSEHLNRQEEQMRNMRFLARQTSLWSSFLCFPQTVSSLVVIDYFQASHFFLNELPNMPASMVSTPVHQYTQKQFLERLNLIANILHLFSVYVNVPQSHCLKGYKHVGLNVHYYWTKEVQRYIRPFLDIYESAREQQKQSSKQKNPASSSAAAATTTTTKPPHNPKIPTLTKVRFHGEDMYVEKKQNVLEIVQIYLNLHVVRKLVESNPLLEKLSLDQICYLAQSIREKHTRKVYQHQH